MKPNTTPRENYSPWGQAKAGLILAMLVGGAPDAQARTVRSADASLTRCPPPVQARRPTPNDSSDQVHSPLTAEVIRGLRQLVTAHPTRDNHAFIKVGDSHTAAPFTLTCLARQRLDPAIRARRPGLEETRRHFARRLRTGGTSFDRRSLAARGGHHAEWALGRPRWSPLAREVAQVNPRFAFVAFGTNDMALSGRYDSSLRPFLTAMDAIVIQLTARGIVPIVVGLPPRLDSPTARLWAMHYNNATRSLAARHRVPFVDMHAALQGAPRFGLDADGIHGTALIEKRLDACDFSPRGLRHGYNVRNLVLLDALDRVRRAVLPAPNAATVVAGR